MLGRDVSAVDRRRRRDAGRSLGGGCRVIGARMALLLSCGLALGSACASAPPATNFVEIETKIERVVADEGVPSMAVAVARDGRILWEAAFGMANKEAGLAATPHTPYSLASISKPITATGLMILVERALVDLDRPINEYLGDAKVTGRAGPAREATMRRVANHTSGLPLHYQFFYADEPYRRPPMDETIRRYANLVTAPGERFQYSNLGYGLIDYVIARRSGMSYAEFTRAEVFEPLGMSHSAVGVPPGLEDQQAVRYAPDGTPIPFYDFDHRGGSAVYASAHDLIRFAMFHLGDDVRGQRAVISEASRQVMQRPTAEMSPKAAYGIGWGTDKCATGAVLVGHNGGMGGVSTSLTMVPEHDLAVAVLANSSSRWPGVITKDVLNALLPGCAEESENDDDSAPATDLQPLQGTWRGTLAAYTGDLPFSITIRDDTVIAALGDAAPTPVDNVTFRNRFFTGRFPGTIGTPDVERRDYRLQLDLKLRGDVLNGSVIALSTPGERVGNALTHWAELKRPL
ncbi:MAG: serine hydrolase [Luteitalea sp.]|nr:serine hydrolase [Luteitalea sp.]